MKEVTEKAVAYLQDRFSAVQALPEDTWHEANRLFIAAQVLMGVDGKTLSREGVLAAQLLAIDIAESLGDKLP